MGRDEDQTSDNMKPPPPRARAVAVALAESENDKAPRVVATGRGSVAEQILALAFAKGIKVREDADLAELLSAIEPDNEIPLEAFTAVAEILSYVYRANGDPRAGAPIDPGAWLAGREERP